MKKNKITAILLTFVFVLSVFSGCSSTDKPEEEAPKIREPEYITLFADAESDYTIVRPEVANANSSTVLPPNTPANLVMTAAIKLASGGL